VARAIAVQLRPVGEQRVDVVGRVRATPDAAKGASAARREGLEDLALQTVRLSAQLIDRGRQICPARTLHLAERLDALLELDERPLELEDEFHRPPI
jgi:hypothetical protein